MKDDRIVAIEDGVEDLKAELVALRHTVTAITLALFTADGTAVERIHNELIAFASTERERGSERAERKAGATEVLADRLLMAARQALPQTPLRSEDSDG